MLRRPLLGNGLAIYTQDVARIDPEDYSVLQILGKQYDQVDDRNGQGEPVRACFFLAMQCKFVRNTITGLQRWRIQTTRFRTAF